MCAKVTWKTAVTAREGLLSTCNTRPHHDASKNRTNHKLSVAADEVVAVSESAKRGDTMRVAK